MTKVHALLIGTSLAVLPLLASAAPPETAAPPVSGASGDLPPSTPPPAAPAPGGQVQGQSGQGQTLPTPPATGGGGSTNINFQPQIQVQVQPHIDVEAKPQADAGANANANANSTATPTATADADITANAAPAPSAPGGTVPAPGTTVVKETRVVRHYEVPKPAEPPPVAPYKPNTRRRSGLMIAGYTMFGISYITSVINGVRIHNRCDMNYEDPGDCKQFAKQLYIPVAGPFMAIDDTSRDHNKVKLGINGGVQSLGVFFALIGTGMYVRDGYRNRLLNEHGIRVSKNTYVNPMANGLTLTHRF